MCMHATPCINHAKFPYARLVSPDRNITPSLAPTSSAYRDVPLLLDRTERRGGGSSLRWFNVGSRLTGGGERADNTPSDESRCKTQAGEVVSAFAEVERFHPRYATPSSRPQRGSTV